MELWNTKLKLLTARLMRTLIQPFGIHQKKRGEHKRKYIGKTLDGVFIPNKRFQLERQVESSAPKRGPVPEESCTRKFYGAT